MKKKIIILGSTGSIGVSTLSVIKENKKNFNIILLTANKNYKKLIHQAKEFKVKNVLITNKLFYKKVRNSLRKTKTKVFTGNIPINKITNEKIDYSMSAIVGLAGLQPTIDVIKISKTVAIANKEAIICGWDILSKSIKKYKTNLVPVDSEHFSIMELTKNINDSEIREIIITASGGPFLKTSIKNLKNVDPKKATKHPNWKMGKKISIDSANMMNKVFEVIEACKLFQFNKNKYKILIHPQSQVHSIIHFKNGLTKMILYSADMKIPISNTLYGKKNIIYNNSNINLKTLNQVNFQKVDNKKFPAIQLINKILNSGFSAPIIVNAANEILVNLFLRRKIGFLDIVKNIKGIINDKDFNKYAKRKPKSVKDIKKIDNWARLKTINRCVI